VITPVLRSTCLGGHAVEARRRLTPSIIFHGAAAGGRGGAPVILGIGLDVVATERIARSLADDGSDFEAHVFTAAEREECRERADRTQALGARFAAKEACFKALGTGWAQGVSFHQVEVRGLEGGRPELRLSGAAAERAHALGVRHIHVSLTHEADVAAAVVVLEGGAVS